MLPSNCATTEFNQEKKVKKVFSPQNFKFEVGQWVDVKLASGKWVEGVVLLISTRFIQNNGELGNEKDDERKEL